MLKVTIGTTTERNSVILDPNTTLRQALTDNNVDVSPSVTIMLDGTPMIPSQLDNTFASFGLTDSCMLIATINTKNA